MKNDEKLEEPKTETENEGTREEEQEQKKNDEEDEEADTRIAEGATDDFTNIPIRTQPMDEGENMRFLEKKIHHPSHIIAPELRKCNIVFL